MIKYSYFAPKRSHKVTPRYPAGRKFSTSSMSIYERNPNNRNQNPNNNNNNNNESQNDSKRGNQTVYQEGIKAEGAPCDKMCNGIKKMRVKIGCREVREDAHCPPDKIKYKLVETACNTHCRLQ